MSMSEDLTLEDMPMEVKKLDQIDIYEAKQTLDFQNIFNSLQKVVFTEFQKILLCQLFH